MEKEFKPGDKIKRTGDNYGSKMKHGEIYTFRLYGNHGETVLEVDEHLGFTYDVNKFKLVQRAEANYEIY